MYQSEKIINALVERIEANVQKISNDYEIILVEDGGSDKSWEVIEKIAKINKNVFGIKLSRNFGQHYAITAGLEHVKGDWIIVMDCDLQDKPEEIEKLYRKAEEGYDIVLARRSKRKDTFLKKLFSTVFYRTLGYLTGSEQDEAVANFGIYSKKVINSIVSMQESIRYFPTMVKWVGFRSTKIDVEHDSRFEGKTSYNLSKLFNLAIDIILAYSDKPIRLLIQIGFFISLLSIIMTIRVIFQWLFGEIVVLGYASLFISICFFSGIIIITLGVVGLYVGKTFECVKKRPIYIISEKVNYN